MRILTYLHTKLTKIRKHRILIIQYKNNSVKEKDREIVKKGLKKTEKKQHFLTSPHGQVIIILEGESLLVVVNSIPESMSVCVRICFEA